MKPTAITLADELDTHISSSTSLAAAQELRRLQFQSEKLIELLQANTDLIKCFVSASNSPAVNQALVSAVVAVEHLTKPKGFMGYYDAKNKTKRFNEPKHDT
jgi:hypothetical protein